MAQVLAGRYELEVPLGRGVTSEVWRARRVSTRKPIAVKRVELTKIQDSPLRAETVARFRREAEILGRLRHPNIVTALEAGRIGDELFLVMELVEGVSLASMLDQRQVSNLGPFPVPSALRVVEQACAGLSAAHGAGLVHRDVKPSHLMVATRLSVKIVGFDIARLLHDDSPRLAQPTQAIGALAYTPPEQLAGIDVDGRADLYSLGCVLYELLAGRPPFTAEVPTELLRMQLQERAVPLERIRSDLPAGLSRLVDAMMQKDRSLRPADADEVLRRIQAISGGNSRGSQGRREAPASVASTGAVGHDEREAPAIDARSSQGVQIGTGNVQYNTWGPKPLPDPAWLGALNPFIAMARLQLLSHDDVVDLFARASPEDTADLLGAWLAVDRDRVVAVLGDIRRARAEELIAPLAAEAPWLASLPEAAEAISRRAAARKWVDAEPLEAAIDEFSTLQGENSSNNLILKWYVRKYHGGNVFWREGQGTQLSSGTIDPSSSGVPWLEFPAADQGPRATWIPMADQVSQAWSPWADQVSPVFGAGHSSGRGVNAGPTGGSAPYLPKPEGAPRRPWVVPGYVEERQMGRGASGRVVAAVRQATGQKVAIKYLAPKLFDDSEFLAGFRAEAGLMRPLDVRYVVRLVDYVEAPGEGAAIVMELVEGVSLHEMITRRGPLGPEPALMVLKGSLLGLAAAHALGIVHRDYKPENVLIDAEGNSKLSDFGVAAREGSSTPAAGTPLYMAPEQWDSVPTTASDVYAATAVFFECLTGLTPFSGRLGELQRQHMSAPVPLTGIDKPLHGLITRGMAKDPAQRPANAIEFLAELTATVDASHRSGWTRQVGRQIRQRVSHPYWYQRRASLGGRSGRESPKGAELDDMGSRDTGVGWQEPDA